MRLTEGKRMRSLIVKTSGWRTILRAPEAFVGLGLCSAEWLAGRNETAESRSSSGSAARIDRALAAR